MGVLFSANTFCEIVCQFELGLFVSLVSSELVKLKRILAVFFTFRTLIVVCGKLKLRVTIARVSLFLQSCKERIAVVHAWSAVGEEIHCLLDIQLYLSVSFTRKHVKPLLSVGGLRKRSWEPHRSPVCDTQVYTILNILVEF